jgi:hypothetical protein
MKLQESLLLLQPIVGVIAILFGALMVAVSVCMHNPNRKVHHPILGELTVRNLTIICGFIMTLFGGLLV